MNIRRVRITRVFEGLLYEFQEKEIGAVYKTIYYLDQVGSNGIAHTLVEKWLLGYDIDYDGLRIAE